MKVQSRARFTHLPSRDDPQLAAFRRLLADAHHGGQAKVDAMVALAQRTIHVVPWPGGIEGWRTLVNSEGVAALPMFTSMAELDSAARRYGWLEANGSVPAAEVGARAALNYAIREKLSYVIIDVAAEHALELAREEFEPLLVHNPRHDSSGPYAGAGKVSSSLMRAVRPTPPPMRTVDIQAHMAGSHPTPIDQPAVREGFSSSPGFIAAPNVATFGGGTSVTITPLTGEPPDALLDVVANTLRGYPEVEWASFCIAARGPSPASPTIALRIDGGYRQRLNEIITSVRRLGESHGAALDVLLLDDAALMRTARGQGVVFYPWRKK
jgi:hypothetical protein